MNWWLVVEGGAATLVDGGLPAQLGQLDRLLGALDLRWDAVRAIVATHGHIDHVACIEAVRSRSGADVYVPHQDHGLATRRQKLDLRVALNSWRPAAIGSAASYVRQGVLTAAPLTDAFDLHDGDIVDGPGGLQFRHAPGHTEGSGVFVTDHGALFSGDVLVTLDPFTGRTGPRTLPAFDNVDHAQALRSLEVVACSEAAVVLPGHGEPWHGQAAEAARLARLAS